jgi:hypothetical protein
LHHPFGETPARRQDHQQPEGHDQQRAQSEKAFHGNLREKNDDSVNIE